jgi:hypothetical protein
MLCSGCGDHLPAYRRPGARHCSNACRQAAYRRRRRAGLEALWPASAASASAPPTAPMYRAGTKALGARRFDPRALIA